MDFSGIIKINKAIVHILNQEEKFQRLSDFEITTDKKLDNLIIKHINTSIKHDARRFAQFDKGENIVRQSCIKILNNADVFVEESKNISRQLFLAMKGTNASSANLLIVQYKHGQEEAVAILKLDFDDSFHTEEKKEGEKIKIVVKIDGAGFNKRQKLQKCVFVYADILIDNDSKIVILDKQASEDISNYFGSTFLNCILVNDDKANTKNMIKEFNEFINEIYKSDPKQQISKTYELTSIFQSNKSFELENILNRLFDEEKVKNEFKDKIECKEIDYSFNIDKSKVEKHLKSRAIITESGISLKGQASLFNNEDINITDEYDEGYVDIIIKKVKIKGNIF
ncbi:nucleoid-associated protein [Clostridium tagluense]|uniref:nucleoid-associated protein n=1 Tax=Clostridium tagluense TaxID=360422 RepID=UPI001C6DF32E|nr:nucleoid-associated protein [Clostridium tagluense]MBW9157232.1 nucleoid-associated protein [Clostridium tagluense]MCB2297818.1 nucleoid-associated protein [Clostridium tagluense]WLC67168.1 nucleoid-associated protein [Clostridium tagluense]